MCTAIGSMEHGGRVKGLSSKLSLKDGFEKDWSRYRSHDFYKEEIVAAAETAMEAKFKDLLRATLAEQQSGQLFLNSSQEVGQHQLVVMPAPPPVLAQPSTCAQSSVASTTGELYPVDRITTSTPCLLLYPIGRAGKTKEVAKAQVEPVVGLFEGKPIPPLYACVQVEQILNSIYEYNEIDIPTADGKNCLGQCVGSTILWHKRDIVLLDQVPARRLLPAPPSRDTSPPTPRSPPAPPSQNPSAPSPRSPPAPSRDPSPPAPQSPPAQSQEASPPAP